MDSCELSKTHPILQLSVVQTVYFDECELVDENKDSKQRFIKITSVGVFILKERKFPAGFKCSFAFGYYDLLSIHSEEDVITIKTKRKKLNIKSRDSAQILRYIKTILHVILNDMNIDADDSSTTDENLLTYKNKKQSIIPDRFLTLLIHDITFQDCDHVISVYRSLNSMRDSIFLTPDIINSNLLKSYLKLILSFTFPFELIIKDCEYYLCIPALKRIVQTSNYLYKLTFKMTSFNDFPIEDYFVFTSIHKTSITEISWIQCNFSTTHCKLFLEDFTHYNGKITSILCEKCAFQEKTLVSFFNSLYDAPSVHKVETFHIGGIYIYDLFQVLLIQFVNNSLVLVNKQLKKLSISRSNIDINYVLPTITLFETGIDELEMIGCRFIKDFFPPGMKNFFTIQKIDFSETKFTSHTLLLLFSAFSTCSNEIKSIKMNNLDIDKGDLSIFYKSLRHICIPNMESFFWEKNEVNEDDSFYFFEFLQKHHLSTLDISFSIVSTQNNLKVLCNYLEPTNLKQLYIKGAGNTCWTDEFSKLIQILTLNPNINTLDITGQKFGDKGITDLIKLINNQLHYIGFGNSNASITSLLNLLEAINASSILNADWNPSELINALRIAQPEEKQHLNERIMEVKKVFYKKFNSLNRSSSISSYPSLLRTTTIKKNDENTIVVNNNGISIKSNLCYEEIITKIDGEIKDLLDECIAEDRAKDDPLLLVFKELKRRTKYFES
ncbi:hypothetical protein TRFO_00838 [Tritrichomonas foetus]|uniref:Leucine Rich Repeat family protein n=1 Tax=Tritrichomonas foetus TaxID=1144522 RepID=A0A1J4L2B3_9EUKA|nr:hypothetical protein TRFO_00838 [Tritrichomonas foetus]|eukprot:OHT17587.1 hypothetical protein TRFO_00838 [Tritrichomonas foetus]